MKHNSLPYRSWVFICSFCVINILWSSVIYGQTVDMYLIAGQSNALGLAPSAGLPVRE